MSVTNLREYRACNYPERPFGCTQRELEAFNRASYQVYLHEQRRLSDSEILLIREAARENRPIPAVLFRAS